MSFFRASLRYLISRQGSVLFLSFLLFIAPRQSFCHLTLDEDDLRIIVDEASGAFAFCSTNLPGSAGPLESGGGQFSSYAVIYRGGKPFLIGGDRGRLEKCGFDGNTIGYSWSSGGSLYSEKFFFSSSSGAPSPGVVCSFRPRAKSTAGKNETVKILIVLDLEDVVLFDLPRKARADRFTVWTNLDGQLFSAGNQWFRIKTPPDCGQPVLVVFDDWNEIYSRLGDPRLFQERGKRSAARIRDPAVAVLWSFPTDCGKTEERGLILERFVPAPDQAVCSIGFDGPVEILPEMSQSRLTVRNDSFVPLKNAVLGLSNDGNFILEKSVFRLGDIPAFTSVTQKFYCCSLSPRDRTGRITSFCRFGPDKAPLLASATQECLVRRAPLPAVCDIVSNASPPSFSLRWLERISFSTQRLIIEDLDGRVLEAIPVSGRTAGIFPSTVRFPAGSTYNYWAEAVRGNDVLTTEKKTFTTDPEREEKEDSIVIRFPSVNFNYNSAALKSQAYSILKKVVFLLRQHPGKKIRIEGHTDNTGIRQVNLGLSLQRASAVSDYLTGVEGFDPGRFEIRGLADSFPVAANDTEENRFKNRRVEIIIEK